MNLDFIVDVFEEYANNDAIIWNDTKYSYKSLINNMEKSQLYIDTNQIQPGTVIALIGDYSPNSIALLLALIKHSCIIVPLIKQSNNSERTLFDIAQVESVFRINDNDKITTETVSERTNNDYYKLIRKRKHPGLVLFTSGTSGKPKAAVHDFFALLEKFKPRRKSLKTLNFLLFDHWGGLNTMLHILSNGGVAIATKNRTPENICRLIETHKIELLPASPTFLKLLLLSGEHDNYDLNSLKIISYGTEPMSESTLKRLIIIFPGVKLLQTYGLIELGVMHSQSEEDDSLWVKLGGEGYQTRVVEGLLEIKAKSAMLGYLNAPSPFTEDGWFKTSDVVEVKGEYFKVLGRNSEIINVGGEKVFPQEVETVIQELDNVNEIIVYSEKNSIIGDIVCAKVRLQEDEDIKAFTRRLKHYCRNKLQRFKIPIKIKIVEEELHNARYKKLRNINEDNF